MKKQLPFLLLFLVMFSCKKELEKAIIYANSGFIDSNIVIIDDTIKLETYYYTDKRFTDFKIEIGKHTVKINESSIKEFYVEKNGGILNVAKEKFVIFPILYAENEILGSMVSTVSCPIIIDSLIIYKSSIAKDQDQLNAKINNPSYKDQFMKSRNMFNEDILFIPKNWDYNVDDMIPEMIVAQDKSIMNTSFKYKISIDYDFLIYAMNSYEYKVEKIENKELESFVNEIQNNQLLPIE